MNFIDLHCDTLMLAAARKERTLRDLPYAMADVSRLRGAGALAQFFAIFFPPREAYSLLGLETPPSDGEYFALCHAIFTNTLRECGELIKPAASVGDILENHAGGAVSAFLTFEDGRIIGGDMEKLRQYRDLGIRLITLTWNGENCFGYPNSPEPEASARGLKPFGIEAVREMNRLGVLVDVSHLSDGGFWDVVRYSGKPFVASHSNARALSPHPRNLTDEMIRAVAERGGVVGVNYCPAFLNADIAATVSTVELVLQHVAHIVRVGGEDTAALGSDWDGIQGEIELRSPQSTRLLFERAEAAGYSASVIEKIASKNVLRVLRETIG